MNHYWKSGLLAAALALAGPAEAHVTLETAEATVGASYKAVLMIGHGCGAEPTLRVKVLMPEGFIGVKPMPKAGWTLETTRAPYARTYEAPHVKASEGVREIIWSGGSLPNDWYDEFIFTGVIAADLNPGTTLYFPIVQECEKSAEKWTEIPSDDAHAHHLESPAPGLKLSPPDHSHHH